MVPISEVSEVTDRHRTAADLYIANRLLAAAHAIQEILAMIIAIVEPNSLITQGLLRERCGGGFEFATIHQDFSFAADKKNTVAVAVKHLHTVSVEIA